MRDTSERGGAAVQLLRQLGVAFSTYRLYPGDLAQPALTAAVERIEEAARALLSAGPVDAGVRSGRFHLGAEPVDDDRADRLADACFHRRVQHLQIRRVPTLAELDALFDALTRSPADVDAAGGVDALLAARGVRALTASEGAPDPSSGRADPEGELVAAERYESQVPPQDPDAALPPLAAVSGETAEGLYQRLQAVSDALPDDVLARSSLFRRAAELAAGLASEERTTFAMRVLDRAASESFAERYVGHLTDVDLAALVAEVGQARGEDPVALAAETATVTGRHDALVRLVEAAVVRAAGRSPAARAPQSTAEEHAAPEGRRLRDAFPTGADSGRQLALTTLRDYLRSDPDLQQAERVVAAVTGQLRSDVHDCAPDRIHDLLTVLEGARPHIAADSAPLLEAPRRHTLTPAVLAELAAALAGEGTYRTDVLKPFGPAAVDALVEALGDETRRTVRGLLVGLLAAVVADDPARLAPYVGDPRWFVARNLATALRRTGGPSVLPLLERLATHPHEAVRHEALQGLAALSSEDAAPALARLAVAYERREDQEASLQALAGLASPVATRLLAELGSRRTRPRLRWGLRRQARALARRGSPA